MGHLLKIVVSPNQYHRVICQHQTTGRHRFHQLCHPSGPSLHPPARMLCQTQHLLPPVIITMTILNVTQICMESGRWRRRLESHRLVEEKIQHVSQHFLTI